MAWFSPLRLKANAALVQVMECLEVETTLPFYRPMPLLSTDYKIGALILVFDSNSYSSELWKPMTSAPHPPQTVLRQMGWWKLDQTLQRLQNYVTKDISYTSVESLWWVNCFIAYRQRSWSRPFLTIRAFFFTTDLWLVVHVAKQLWKPSYGISMEWKWT